MRPEDVLPDCEDQRSFGGVNVRKGTVGAFVANHRVLTDPSASTAEKTAALSDMVDLLPGMEAVGVFEVFELRDPAVLAQLNHTRQHPRTRD